MATSKEKIMQKAIEILRANPDGVYYSELVRRIKSQLKDIPINTIHGIVWNLDTRAPNEFYKPARGLFRHVSFRKDEAKEEIKPCAEIEKIKEEFFINLSRIGW